MNQSVYELFLSGVFIGFLFTICLAIIILAVQDRRRKQIVEIGDLLYTLAGIAVTRYTNAKTHTDRDEWIITDRAMDNLDAAVQKWAKATNDHAD